MKIIFKFSSVLTDIQKHYIYLITRKQVEDFYSAVLFSQSGCKSTPFSYTNQIFSANISAVKHTFKLKRWKQRYLEKKNIWKKHVFRKFNWGFVGILSNVSVLKRTETAFIGGFRLKNRNLRVGFWEWFSLQFFKKFTFRGKMNYKMGKTVWNLHRIDI